MSRLLFFLAFSLLVYSKVKLKGETKTFAMFTTQFTRFSKFLYRMFRHLKTAQRLQNAHKITAPLGRTHSTYARPSTPQETTIWRATRRKAFPQCPKETFQGQFKGLPQDIYHRSELLGSWSTGQMWVEGRDIRGHQEIWSQQNTCSRAAQAGKERKRQVLCSCHPPLPTLSFKARIGFTCHLCIHLTNQYPPPWRWDDVFRRHRRTSNSKKG